MKLKHTISLLIFLFCYSLNGQNMQEGFSYLESGDYNKAESYFKEILIAYPENKTARLCYGRAVGLNGDPKKALTLFSNLVNDYPEDFEVKLNYGESLLWNKNYTKAKTYFKKLIIEQPKSFPALLSYANTLSNLKEYDEALNYVNKALSVSNNNPNALTSKKYIYLGYAYKKQQEQSYEEAEKLLLKNLELFNNDKETLLNLANLYLIVNKLDLAQNTYNQLKNKTPHTIEALNGLALVYHLKGKEKLALNTSKEAYQALKQASNKSLTKQTTERYIQALIWNKKYKEANLLINNLIKEQPNTNWILALRATLNIYKSDFKKSLTDYNTILKNDSTSFDGNLGKANTLKALNQTNQAYKSAQQTLNIYNNQKDALNFIKNIENNFTPFYGGKASYSFDNGDNNAVSLSNSLQFPLSTKLKLQADYIYRKTDNKVTNFNATSNDFTLGGSYKLTNTITANVMAGISSADANNANYNQFLTDVSLDIKPFKLQQLKVGYKRDLQNFNAELLNRQIVQNNYYANYSLNTNFNLGWFTQYFYTSQNDQNNRHLLFTSLYYNILAKPSLKAGLNYQYITFKNQVPTIYFSPEQFNAGEVFVNLIKDENVAKPKEWFYELTAATGLQFIEDNESQSTYRIQSKLGYKFSDRCLANIFGVRSNIASATAAGFTYTEVGVRFKWLIFKRPVFKLSE